MKIAQVMDAGPCLRLIVVVRMALKRKQVVTVVFQLFPAKQIQTGQAIGSAQVLADRAFAP
jgi:hypothetical protein